jgi:cell wall-associated NlpC family hydrolase
VALSRTLRATALAASSLLTAAAIGGFGPPRAQAEPPTADPDREATAASQKLETIVEQFNTAQEGLRVTQDQLAAADAQLAPLAQQVDELQRQVATIAVGAYKATGDSPLTTLLGANSPGMLLNQLMLLDHLARDHKRDLNALRAATDRYQAQRRDLAALAGRQATESAELSASKAAVESALAQWQSLRAQAPEYGQARATRGAARDWFVPVFPDDPGGAALRFAFAQLGKNYQWAAAGPDTYDCSGLVLASWRTVGRNLPHSAAMQWNGTPHIQRDQLRPGDLVFYFNDIHHVAMYAGDGRVIQAPRTGEQVSVHQMDFAPIHGYGRVP